MKKYLLFALLFQFSLFAMQCDEEQDTSNELSRTTLAFLRRILLLPSRCKSTEEIIKVIQSSSYNK